MWTIILWLPLTAYIFIFLAPLASQTTCGPNTHGSFSTEQADLLVHVASLDVMIVSFPQPPAFSLFGDEKDYFM